MQYRRINSRLEELRLVSILHRPDQEQAEFSAVPHRERDDLVHCTLEHYSLAQDRWTRDSLSKDPGFSLDWTAVDCQDENQSNSSEPDDSRLDISARWRFDWGDFVALSYTWGDPADKKAIVINGEVVRVQANLEAALRVLRSKKPMRSGYRIWVDAICIKQEDLAERSREVRRMRMIYGLAADVVIWLGPEAEDSNKAMDLILTLSNSCKNGTDKSLGVYLRSNPEYLVRGSWLALSKLLERQYWYRMWIIQELCLGGSKSPILCGDKVIIWEDFFSALYSFGKHNVDVIFACIDGERKAAGLTPFGLNRNKIIHINLEHHKQAGREKAQYMPLLDLARKSDALNPIDKVYGILGLMHHAVSSLTTLDYSLSVEEVYTNFARQYIEATGSLEILEQCRLKESPMPSWAPDWRNKNHYRLFSGHHSTYSAGSASTASYHFRSEACILDVDGVILDAVDGLGQAYFEYGTSSLPEHAVFQPNNTASAYGCEDSIKDALWRTLTGDRTLQGHPAPDNYAEILNLPFRESCQTPLPSRGARALSRFITQSASLSVSGRRLDSFFNNSLDQFPETAIDAVERIWRFTRTHRLVVTLSGRIGMVPIEAKKGDVLCILLSSDVPVLLRPAKNPRDPVKLVGSCYIHGIMAGEAMRWIEDGILKVETISIC
ncbi:hypothetical protein COCMIDRAFT_1312 [Bipolaris oryzae ATCC 44560]|uniref:Heterokaryon incompatibility domain-containing protein n=1 Tax=Bipolaris oryzae ATCC 44560 TaxID=930090 RepID=W6ZIS8_COCMI|nr:uncharacterized protein COCMIDRAFT_1312 [Bipolaris oryzae ATCC 44560]EUC49898.1 hypothetical protein COCMIDRAFT_1312 [Bipolaris oryzae ATCC 44560]